MQRGGKRASAALYGTLGFLLFAVSGLWLYQSGLVIEQLYLTPLHTDSHQYLCYALQMAPLDSEAGTDLQRNIAILVDRPTSISCFESGGQPALLLETVYPRLVLSWLLAITAISQVPILVLALPLVVFGAIGSIWGLAVSELKWVWGPARILLLMLPALALSSVLWLSPLMTEGLFTLLLLVSLFLNGQAELNPHRATPFALGMIICAVLLSLTRPSWLISGSITAIAIWAIFRQRWRHYARLERLQRLIIQGGILIGSCASFLGLERFVAALVTPEADFPVANQPQNTLPLNPTELFLIIRVFLDVQTTGISQAIRIRDLGTVALIAVVIAAFMILVLRKRWRPLVIVFSTWLVGIVTSGVVTLCCGGLDTYFRYTIPAMIATIYAGAQAFRLPPSHFPCKATRNTSWTPHTS